MSRFSIPLIYLHNITKKCESTPGIILQQVNFMSGLNIFSGELADAWSSFLVGGKQRQDKLFAASFSVSQCSLK